MHPKSIAIIGAGSRGQFFGQLIGAAPHLGKVTAVAEPRDDYRKALVAAHQIPAENVFTDWRDLMSRPKFFDAAVVSTMDREHVGPAVACFDKGIDILLEKPMGISLDECRRIEAAQRRSGRIGGVCHSQRYHHAFRRLREIAASGQIGQVMTIDQLEQVGMYHQAHSFVRGNWGNEGRSTFMLLAKSCHDLDFMAYLIDKPCLSVVSYGALSYFRRENAPLNSTERCTDGCPVEPTCPYSAIKQYVDGDRDRGWAVACSLDHSYESHLRAIKTGPYGRCVWKCDNDVVDHQIVAMQFAGGVTATFTMTAFSLLRGRRVRVHGTLGTADLENLTITTRLYADRSTQTTELVAESGAHGGGDHRIVREWLHALHTRDDSRVVANIQESLKTHTIAFAAERSRREGRLVRIEEMNAVA